MGFRLCAGLCSGFADLLMSKEQAHKILDGVRAGVRYPLHIINLALLTTGDLCLKSLKT